MGGVGAPGKKRDRPAREQSLIRAATRLFAVRGYESTTTREIAAAAGCAEGLIHRYFKGKAGLLLAIVESRTSEEVRDLSQQLRIASNITDEILQLVSWEVDRMWDDREFFNIVIPRAMVQPSLGKVIRRVGPQHRANAIAERLRRFPECRALEQQDLDALAHFVGITGFMFGYMRPFVLRQDRKRARATALNLAAFILRGLKGGPRNAFAGS